MDARKNHARGREGQLERNNLRIKKLKGLKERRTAGGNENRPSRRVTTKRKPWRKGKKNSRIEGEGGSDSKSYKSMLSAPHFVKTQERGLPRHSDRAAKERRRRRKN